MRSLLLGRRAVALTVALVMASLWALQAWALHGVGFSSFCDGSGIEALGEGPQSQVGVHTDVFKPAFSEYLGCETSPAPLYQGTGDIYAVTKLLNRSNEFSASDVPLSLTQKIQIENDLQTNRGRTSPVHQVPLYIDALAIGYNVSCIPRAAAGQTEGPNTRLNLRSQTLSLIFSGYIKYWNDARLTIDNPALTGCNQQISLIKRAGYSGATSILKDYLSKRNPQWAYYKSPERNEEWPGSPSFVGEARNDLGMAQFINTTEYSIGYLQYRVAKSEQVRTAGLDNPVSAALLSPADRFTSPSPYGCVLAATTVVITPGGRVDIPGFYGSGVEIPPSTQQDWSTVSLADAPLGYPVCSFGYFFTFGKWTSAYAGNSPPGYLRTIVDYLWVATTPEAQNRLLTNDYAPLPEGVIKAVRDGIEAMTLY